MKTSLKTKKDCGPDKILNVKTNRCLKKKKTKKCGPDKFLNMKTNRCVKKKKCGPDKILNIKTNRCVKNSVEIPIELKKLIQFVSHPKVSFFIILFTSLHYKKLIFDSTVNVKNIYTLRLWEIFNYRRILAISFSYILLYYQLYSSKSIDEKRIELFLITGIYALLFKYEDAVKLFIETYIWSKILDFLRKLFQQPTEEEEEEEQKEQECECDCDQTQPPDDNPDIKNPIRQIIKQIVKGIGNFLQNILYFTGSKIIEGIKYISYQIFITLPYYIFIYPFVQIYNYIFTNLKISDFQQLMKDMKNKIEEKIKQTTDNDANQNTAVQKENVVKIYQTVMSNLLQDPVKRDIVYQETFPSKKTDLSDLVQGNPYLPVGDWNKKKAKQSLEYKPFFVGPDYFKEKVLLPALKKNNNLKLRPYVRKTKNTIGDEFYLIQYEKLEEYDSNDYNSNDYDSNDYDSKAVTIYDSNKNNFLPDSYNKDKMLVSYESDKNQSSDMFLPTDESLLRTLYDVPKTDPGMFNGIVTVVVPASKRVYETFKHTTPDIKEKLESGAKIFSQIPIGEKMIAAGLTVVLGVFTVAGLFTVSNLDVPFWDILNGAFQISVENPLIK